MKWEETGESYGNCGILNMTFSTEICRRLDFGVNILDEPDERISV